MSSMEIPFYQNWTFWAFIISIAAVVLSQIPPIRILVKKAKLDYELFSKICLTHKVGNPNLQIHIIIRNVGGRVVRVKEITARLFRDKNEIISLPTQNYLQQPNDKENVLFTSFTLKPDDEWSHIINLFNYKKEDVRKYRILESNLKQNIIDILKEKGNKPEDKSIVEADDKFVIPFHEFYKDKFIWKPGEYNLHLSIATSHKKGDIEKKYRFTLFESDSEDLAKIKDEYKTGAGIYWDSGTPTSVIVELQEV